jgi:ketosteroid isomerase-like protein
MSREDVESLQAVFQAIADGDATAWLRAMDPEVRLYPRSEEPGVRAVYEGWDGVMEYLVNWYSDWEDYESEPVEFQDAGDQVLVVLRERGRMERSGIEVEEEFSHSFKLRDGRIVEWRHHNSRQDALDALGLSE